MVDKLLSQPYNRWDMEHFAYTNNSVFLAKSCFLRFEVLDSYLDPDLENRINDCIPTSMAAVQAEDVHASF